MLKNTIFLPNRGGITLKGIGKINNITKGTSIKNFKVHESLSFAPFLFLGALFTIFLSQNIVEILKLALEFI